MERKIGETFEFEGKTYKVVKFNGCANCAFKYKNCPNLTLVIGNCIDFQRSDGAKVMFEETKGNKLTINIPEGMEIDLQNSNFDTGVICFKKKQPEFKDGDILLYKSAKFTFFSSIFILNTNGNEMSSYVRFSIGKESIDYDVPVVNLGTDRFRYATEEEKQELFNALAKKGKAWDAEKKQIVDLKPKWTPKPFDKIVAFEELGRKEWVCDMFSHYSKDGKGREVIVGIGGIAYSKAVPFNEKTAKLIGTTKEWKG